MRIIYNKFTDPHFNLAAEEYLLKSQTDDVFMLWRNGPSVIIGKNQNAWAEIDPEFTAANNICVSRRITGGGAVFHDLGNINFSFITRADDSSRLNFKKFTVPVISALGDMGIRASLDGRNDIVVNGYKISGNAQCIELSNSKKPMLLHHGTILFSADMNALAGALKVNNKKIKSKGIKSVRGRVKNITDFEEYCGPREVLDFISALFLKIGSGEPDDFSALEKSRIRSLREEKFAKWEWIFGSSPEFETAAERRFDFGTVTVMLKIKCGVIEDIKFFGDFFGTADVGDLENMLRGCAFEEKHVSERLNSAPGVVLSCIMGAVPDDIMGLMFSKEF